MSQLHNFVILLFYNNQNFKNYIQGAGNASPMPGVLRYAGGHQFAAKTPRSDRTPTSGSGTRIAPAAAPGPKGPDPPQSPKGLVTI
jgi:hypothetical protein